MQENNASTRYGFIRKARNADELINGTPAGNQYAIKVVCLVELSEANYITFGKDLLADYAFIANYTREMYLGSDTAHAMLVTSPDSNAGILVCSEGYNYARYAAVVPDCCTLDLASVPTLSADISIPSKVQRHFGRVR